MEMPSVTSEQMAEADRIVSEEYSITVARMMENAGYQLADFIRRKFGPDDSITVSVGKGNNGGDGLAAARRLHLWGFDVSVNLATRELDGIRREELEILEGLGVEVKVQEFSGADVVLDAMIGYNLEGELRPPFDSMVEDINSSGAEIVSIDIPSGVNPDTGEMVGEAVDPDHVVTLALPKQGLRQVDAEIWIADISIPPEVYERFGVDVSGLFTEDSLVRWG